MSIFNKKKGGGVSAFVFLLSFGVVAAAVEAVAVEVAVTLFF